jgi:hypothetical protein
MRVHTALVGLALVWVVGCGEGGPAEGVRAPSAEAVVNPSSTTGPTTTLYTTPFGLQCAAEVESGTYDYEEGVAGFETVEEAARDWMTNGDGAHPGVGATHLNPVAEPTGRVELVDDSGGVRIVLVARDYGNGWLIESMERCFDG